ncbi:MAG: hypothetical protein HRU03_08850 [Nanoarchaeales archaeon]|nr:hypothetical protein [Nanoarchaeales archaeon]
MYENNLNDDLKEISELSKKINLLEEEAEKTKDEIFNLKLKNLEDIRQFFNNNFSNDDITILNTNLHINPNFSKDLQTLMLAYSHNISFEQAKEESKDILEYDEDEFMI